MPKHHRIKADCIVVAIQEKIPSWVEAIGGPLSITHGAVEHLCSFGERLEPDVSSLPLIAGFLRQIGKVLRANSNLGRAPIGMVELIGFSLTVSGETDDLFLGVRIDEGALYLYGPWDLEGAA